MTISPAFLAELATQLHQADLDLRAAKQSGDEQDELIARGRIADLREIRERAAGRPDVDRQMA